MRRFGGSKPRVGPVPNILSAHPRGPCEFFAHVCMCRCGGRPSHPCRRAAGKMALFKLLIALALLVCGAHAKTNKHTQQSLRTTASTTVEECKTKTSCGTCINHDSTGIFSGGKCSWCYKDDGTTVCSAPRRCLAARCWRGIWRCPLCHFPYLAVSPRSRSVLVRDVCVCHERFPRSRRQQRRSRPFASVQKCTSHAFIGGMFSNPACPKEQTWKVVGHVSGTQEGLTSCPDAWRAKDSALTNEDDQVNEKTKKVMEEVSQ